MVINALIFTAILLSITGPGLIAVLSIDRAHQQRGRRLQRALQNPIIRDEKAAPRPRAVKARGSANGKPGPVAAIDARLAYAGVGLRARDFLVLTAMAGLVAAAALHWVLGLPVVVAVLLGGAAIAAFGNAVLRTLCARRNAAIVAHLPEALDAFARGLKAGRPVADAIGLVVDSTPAPLRDELAMARDMLSVGHDLSETLRRLADRVVVPEVRFFSVATQLQAETGGNLVETVENLADQLRQRRSMRKKIRALSAEARTSAIILSVLPFAVALLLFVINPSYLRPLIADPRGLMMAGFGLISLVSGMVILARMGRLDV